LVVLAFLLAMSGLLKEVGPVATTPIASRHHTTAQLPHPGQPPPGNSSIIPRFFGK
jgi:hypothetical protein